MSTDPLLQPYTLKHLTFRNRIMTTSHEPAYAEDGMPKASYRAYHVERAKAGLALTMTAGSAAVSKDSPPVFNNILAYKDEVVPWMKDLVDECHEHGAKVMIQLTHLGRRTRWRIRDMLILGRRGRERVLNRAEPVARRRGRTGRVGRDDVNFERMAQEARVQRKGRSGMHDRGADKAPPVSVRYRLRPPPPSGLRDEGVGVPADSDRVQSDDLRLLHINRRVAADEGRRRASLVARRLS